MNQEIPNSKSANSVHSVSQHIEGLREGDPQAAQAIWERYVDDLVRVANFKLGQSSRRVVDQEDVVQQAFENFFRQVQQGRFPQLDDREDLWQVLVMLVDRRSKDQIGRLNTQKGGGGRVHGDSINANPSQGPMIENMAVGQDDFRAAELAETIEKQMALLPSDEHRNVALCKLDLMTNAEIRDKLGISLRTVERYLQKIRELWATENTNE